MKNNRFDEIIEKYGKEYALCQMAEECCELAIAALKLIHTWNKTTPMREDEAYEHLVEEIGDVTLMNYLVRSEMLNDDQNTGVFLTMEEKEARMYERLLDGKMEEDVF